MKQRLVISVGACLMIVLVVILTLSVQQGKTPALLSNDVSWPNCKVNTPLTAHGIVGVTGGLDFQHNTCVRSEVAWFPTTALYMNTGWPGTNFPLQFPTSPRLCTRGDSLCLAYNYGFHASLYAINYANAQEVHSAYWWLDVETDNSWTTNIMQNRAALEGMIAATQQNVFGAHIGFYSYPSQWSQVVGSWKPALPSWVATGGALKATAVAACQMPSFTGGPVELSQYTLVLDEDYSCQDPANF